MADKQVLVDTGPLVALLNVRDPFHGACSREIEQLRLPLLTSWLIIAEAAWLLRNTRDGVVGLLQLLDNRVVQCADLGTNAAAWMTAAVKRYADLTPQLADVSLLYLADRHGLVDIFTLDRRDFVVYRTSRGKPFKLLPA